MILLDAAEQFALSDRSQVVMDSKRCLHSRNRYSSCTACFNVCPVNAITIGKPPSFDPIRCGSCFACIPTCPVGVFVADDDVSDLINCISHVEESDVELICGLHPQPETGIMSESLGIRIKGCLAGLGVGAYMTFFILGASKITARTDACTMCSRCSLRVDIHRQVEQSNRLLSAWGVKEFISCTDQIGTCVERTLWNVKNPTITRRDLFLLATQKGQIAMARTLASRTHSAERVPGRDRLRLLSSVNNLPVPPINAELNGLGFAKIIISEACSACGACGKACPTSALLFEKHNDGEYAISFNPKDCIDCGLCSKVCLTDAITIDHNPNLLDVFSQNSSVIAKSGQLVRCDRCHSLMAMRKGVDYCPLCEYKLYRPFGSNQPRKIVGVGKINVCTSNETVDECKSQLS